MNSETNLINPQANQYYLQEFWDSSRKERDECDEKLDVLKAELIQTLNKIPSDDEIVIK